MNVKLFNFLIPITAPVELTEKKTVGNVWSIDEI
jgi:hypothetical protein